MSMGRFSHILLAADFDRTLTNPVSEIPQANIDAILEFEQEGGAFTVATGRSIPMFQARQALVPSNAPLVLYNGAAFYEYETNTLSGADWMPRGRELLLDMAERFPKLWAEVQGLDYHYVIGDCPMRMAFYRSNRCPAKQITIDEIPDKLLKIAFYGEFYDDTVRQFFEYTDEELQYLNAAYDYMRASYGADLVIDRAAARIIDVQKRSVSKGAAVRKLAKQLGRSLVACAGDALNDLSMLELADLAFVPADCERSLRSRGYHMVRPCGDGAIAGVVEYLKSEIF